MTPHLLAEASRMMRTPFFCSSTRASGVMKELAPSTMARAEGVPSGRRNFCQFCRSMVSGRPPRRDEEVRLHREGELAELARELVHGNPLLLQAAPRCG